MGTKVGVNPPKTPVTEGSGDVAPATTPNVCKMPGPPAPFVPTPLPNVGRSSDNLTDGTTKVLIEGKKVAIKGSSFKSKASADAASKGTGGGVVSSTEQGKTEFTAPGSMNVKAEGGNIQVLGDAMINNNKNGGATVPGNLQAPAKLGLTDEEFAAICEAFCAAQARYDKGRNRSAQVVDPNKVAISGSGCTTRDFANRIARLRRQGRLPGANTEQSFFMPPGGGPGQLLTPRLFNRFASNVQGTPLHNFVRGIAGRVRATGARGLGSVSQAAGIRMAKVFSAFNRSAGMYAGHICRPDLTLPGSPRPRVYEAKFRGDSPRPNQKPDYRRCDQDGKYREINGSPECCNCP